MEARQEQAATRARAVTAELRSRQPGRLAALEHAPPAEVIAALGERPEGPRDRAVWQQTAAALEAYVERYGSAAVTSAGTQDPAQDRDRQAVAEQVAAVRCRSEAAVEWRAGHEPSVGERVGWVVSVEAQRAEQDRQAREQAKKAPKYSEDYSYDHSFTQEHHRGISHEPPSISIGP